MESFLPDTVKTVLLGLIAMVIVLGWLAGRLPHVRWLQVFRLPAIPMTEEQKARRRRSGNRQAGLEIIVAGLALPLLYVAATVMMFNDFEPVTTILVGVGSLACIVVGTWIFVRNLR